MLGVLNYFGSTGDGWPAMMAWGPMMMGYGVWSTDSGVGYFLSLVYHFFIQGLFLVLLVALLRWLWKKGS